MGKIFKRRFIGNVPRALRDSSATVTGIERVKGRNGSYTYRTLPWGANGAPLDGREATFYDHYGRPERE